MNGTNNAERDARSRSEAPRFLSVEGVAQLLHLTPATVRTMLRSGELDGGFQVGPRGIWRIEGKDVDTYVERRKAQGRQRREARR